MVSATESYPLSMARFNPYDAIKAHKSRVVSNTSNQGIYYYINQKSGIILRDLFKMLIEARSLLDIKKVPDITFIEEGVKAKKAD